MPDGTGSAVAAIAEQQSTGPTGLPTAPVPCATMPDGTGSAVAAIAEQQSTGPTGLPTAPVPCATMRAAAPPLVPAPPCPPATADRRCRSRRGWRRHQSAAAPPLVPAPPCPPATADRRCRSRRGWRRHQSGTQRPGESATPEHPRCGAAPWTRFVYPAGFRRAGSDAERQAERAGATQTELFPLAMLSVGGMMVFPDWTPVPTG